MVPTLAVTRSAMSSSSSWSEDESEEELLKDSKAYYSRPLPRSKHSLDILPINSVQFAPEVNAPGGICVEEVKPDGGWGWMVVLGVALSNMTTQALLSVFGLLFIQRLMELGIGTKGASVILGVQTTTLNLTGLIIGPLIKKLTFRVTAAMGALFVVSGLLLTTLADSLPKFIFSYSLFTGLGLGVLNPTTFVAINAYFSKRRGRAVGLSLTGTGIGQMLLPFLVQCLLNEYGFNGTILILAGLAMHSFLGAMLFQPVKCHLKGVVTGGGQTCEAGKPETDDGSACNVDGYERKRKVGFLYKLTEIFNLDLMLELSFVNHLIGLGFVYVANLCFSMLLPFFLESAAYSRPRIALCMSVLSGADILGRLIVPVFTDGLKIRSRTVFFVGVALSSMARSALVSQNSYEAILILASVCGIVRSALVCNFSLSISDQVPAEKLPSALGLHMLVKGLCGLSFAPLIGFIRDYTKSYTLCVHILSIFFLALPFFSWLLEFLYMRRKRDWIHLPPN